jgi:peptidoglycan hydrolase CwlO-like protein
MKKLLFLLFFILLIGLGIFLIPPSKAQDDKCNNPSNLSLDEINKCLDELNNAKQQSVNATTPLEKQITGIKQRVAYIEGDIAVKEKNIADGYKRLAKQQEILNATVRDYYIKSYYNSPLLMLLSANSATELTQLLGYQKANADRDKAIITNIALSVTDLQQRKIALENEKQTITAIKEKLDKVVADAKAYQSKLSSQISQLSALHSSS